MLTGRPLSRTGTPRSVRAAAVLVLGLVTALALAGCSGGTGYDKAASAGSSASSGSSTSSTSATPTDTASESASATPSESSGATSDDSSAAAPEGSLASREFTVTSTYSQLPIRIRFDLVALQRRDDLLQVVGHLTNTDTDRSKDMRWQVASRFEPTVYREDLSSTNGIFGGVVLTDVANKKRYLVAADSAKDCVCTSNLSGTFLGAGDTVELIATYAAPPASTTKLDVEVPSLGLFRDVPIS